MRSLVRVRLSAAAGSRVTVPARSLPAETLRSRSQPDRFHTITFHDGRHLLHTSSPRLSRSSLTTAATAIAPTVPRRANVVSMYGAGAGAGAGVGAGVGPSPPPPAPTAAAISAATSATSDSIAAEERSIRIARRKAERAALSRRESRLWKAARVVEQTEEAAGKTDGKDALLIGLDKRTARHPTTRQPLRLPAHKRLLAHALAVEWDQLTSVRQASQGHRVPLMSLVCRAVDLEAEMEKTAGTGPLRTALINSLLRYLDTDSLLCWEDEGGEARAVVVVGTAPVRQVLTLHQLQRRTAEPILAYVREHVWPGVAVEPVLGVGTSPSRFLPRPHPPEVREAVRRWLCGLDGWDLAAVERATLAGKSLVVAARLVGEWQQKRAQLSSQSSSASSASSTFSAEDAVAATNMETAFQTAQWGEVEDTHDVDAADMRRHFGSVVLLVAE